MNLLSRIGAKSNAWQAADVWGTSKRSSNPLKASLLRRQQQKTTGIYLPQPMGTWWLFKTCSACLGPSPSIYSFLGRASAVTLTTVSSHHIQVDMDLYCHADHVSVCKPRLSFKANNSEEFYRFFRDRDVVVAIHHIPHETGIEMFVRRPSFHTRFIIWGQYRYMRRNWGIHTAIEGLMLLPAYEH